MEENRLSNLLRGFSQVFTPKTIDKTVDLAEPTSGGSKDKYKELGVKGEQLIRSYENEEIRQDNLKITDYRRMLDNDGQVQMLVNAIFNTILSAGGKIIDDPDLDMEEDSEEKEFVENNLFAPKWKGGMETPMDLINRYFLRAFIEGYRIFEVVYVLGNDGKVRLKKLAPRAGNDDNELKILVDDNGNFIGYRQRMAWGNKPIDIRVINDGDIKKVLHVAYGKEFGSLYGRSGLRAGWYHYDKAHKGMFLNGVGHELGVIKPRIIYTKGAIPDASKTAILRASDRIHLETSILMDEESMKFELLELTDSNVMAQGKDMINLHYSMLSKSLLAQFVDLGSNTSNTGSRSLGESQVDFFKQGLQTMATTLIEESWNEVIADLIKINFDRGVYPRFVMNPLSNEKIQLMYDMLLEMAKNGDLPDIVKKKVIHETSEELGIEVSEEEINQEMEEKREMANEIKENASKKVEEEKGLEERKAMMAEISHRHITLGDGDEPELVDTPMRPLYLNEQKVKFVDIKRQLEDARMGAEVILGKKLSNDKKRIINQYVMALRDGRKAINSIQVELAEQENTYRQELLDLSTGLYEYGKRTASNELNKSIPSTPKKDMVAIQDDVDSIVDEQQTRLELKLGSVAKSMLDNEVPENEAKLMIEQEYDNFWSKILVPTVGMAISKMFNNGRKLALNKYLDEIFAVRYTAVLDSRTTNYCRELDGKVFQVSDPNYALLTPPNHYGCRSFWTPIMKGEEAVGVEVEGKPGDLPVYATVDTFKDVSNE